MQLDPVKPRITPYYPFRYGVQDEENERPGSSNQSTSLSPVTFCEGDGEPGSPSEKIGRSLQKRKRLQSVIDWEHTLLNCKAGTCTLVKVVEYLNFYLFYEMALVIKKLPKLWII
jgi:hypothetical protein